MRNAPGNKLSLSKGVLSGGRRPFLTSHRKTNLWGVLFLLPVPIYFIVFKFYPMAQAIVLGFFDYDMLSAPRFAGLGNYIYLMSDPLFLQSMFATFYYVAGTVIPIWFLSLGLAMLFNMAIPGKDVLRLAYFIPVITAAIVVAVVWKFIYHPQGIMNVMLSYLGMERIEWLTRMRTAMPALIIVAIWRTVPYFMVIFLAGLQSIPNEYYEAALIDGASRWKMFHRITLPLLRPTIVLVMVISVLMAAKVFINPLVMTQGGPAGATRVLPLLIYETGFNFFKMGLASAMSTVLFLIVMIFTIIQLRVFRQVE